MSSSLLVFPALDADLDAATDLFTAYRDFYRRPFATKKPATVKQNPAEEIRTRTRIFLAKRIANKDSILLLARGQHPCVSAEHPQQIGQAEVPIGLALTYVFLDASSLRVSLLLSDLFVREEARRCGAASALLAAVEETAAGLGCSHVFLRTGVGNTAAQRLYAKAGYHVRCSSSGLRGGCYME